MMNYEQYKKFNEAGVIATKELVSREVDLDDIYMSMEQLATASMKHAGLDIDNSADVIKVTKVKGFLGFQIMAAEYPKEFHDDVEFWKDVHQAAADMADYMATGMDEGGAAMLNANPDIIMSRAFAASPFRMVGDTL